MAIIQRRERKAKRAKQFSGYEHLNGFMKKIFQLTKPSYPCLTANIIYIRIA